jgi:hypothetical protein
VQPLNATLPAALARLLAAQPLSPGKVEFAWKAAVGPAVQRVTSVRLEGTELVIEAATADWAREVRRATPVILVRLGTLLGPGVVKGLSVRTEKS